MKTITVSNGDIQLNNGKIQFVTGQNKLTQDIKLWLTEPLGTGFTTPNFGSLLPGMIGGAQNGNTQSKIANEIKRILQLYQGQQVQYLKTAQNTATLSNWNRDEIIQSIGAVNVTVNNSTVIANISLLTLANSNINLNVIINSNGVSVNG
jgi:phage baseplate assembly protein W